jgi:hypothetical protein
VTGAITGLSTAVIDRLRRSLCSSRTIASLCGTLEAALMPYGSICIQLIPVILADSRIRSYERFSALRCSDGAA